MHIAALAKIMYKMSVASRNYHHRRTMSLQPKQYKTFSDKTEIHKNKAKCTLRQID